MSTKEEILDYVMDSPSNTNRSVLDSLLNNFVGEKEIQYVDFTLTDGSITAPADDTVLTICNMDDSNILVVARILSGGFIYYMPLTWRASPGNIIHVAFSISSNGYNRQLTGQHYPNNTEKWSYSSEKIDYIPDEGSVGDVLKKTATGCEWGAVGGGSSIFYIPLIEDAETYELKTTVTCGEFKSAMQSGKIIIVSAGYRETYEEGRTVQEDDYTAQVHSRIEDSPATNVVLCSISFVAGTYGSLEVKNYDANGMLNDNDPVIITAGQS